MLNEDGDNFVKLSKSEKLDQVWMAIRWVQIGEPYIIYFIIFSQVVCLMIHLPWMYNSLQLPKLSFQPYLDIEMCDEIRLKVCNAKTNSKLNWHKIVPK